MPSFWGLTGSRASCTIPTTGGALAPRCVWGAGLTTRARGLPAVLPHLCVYAPVCRHEEAEDAGDLQVLLRVGQYLGLPDVEAGEGGGSTRLAWRAACIGKWVV